jgi:lysozyme family protein
MNFDKSVLILFSWEGGLVNNPKDPGGVTNFGISQRSYPKLNISTLTKDQASEIYKRDFWDKNSIDKFPESLKLTFFDSCVNQGAAFAVTALQKIIGVAADGEVGENTIKTLLGHSEDMVFGLFSKARLERYLQDREFLEFGIGWMRRLFTITLDSLT